MLNTLGDNGARAHKQFVSADIEIAPGVNKAVPLGSYVKSEPAPDFNLDVENGMLQSISASLERQDITGTSRYVMFYQLRNNGSKPCRVTVRRRTAKAKV